MGATDRAVGLIRGLAECFADSRAAELIEHEVVTLVGHRERMPLVGCCPL